MAEPVSLQTLLTYLTLISVPVGVFYHIMTLRNTRKNQELQLETRQINTYLTLIKTMKDLMEEMMEVIYVYQWDDYDDFIEKYGPFHNPSAFAKVWRLIDLWNELGMLVKKGIISMDLIHEQWSGGIQEGWEKCKPLILEWRAAGETNLGESFEYLYDEARKRLPEYPLFHTIIPERTNVGE
jgi:hypothetical protein